MWKVCHGSIAHADARYNVYPEYINTFEIDLWCLKHCQQPFYRTCLALHVHSSENIWFTWLGFLLLRQIIIKMRYYCLNCILQESRVSRDPLAERPPNILIKILIIKLTVLCYTVYRPKSHIFCLKKRVEFCINTCMLHLLYIHFLHVATRWHQQIRTRTAYRTMTMLTIFFLPCHFSYYTDETNQCVGLPSKF